jgi:hypothetical protein
VGHHRVSRSTGQQDSSTILVTQQVKLMPSALLSGCVRFRRRVLPSLRYDVSARSCSRPSVCFHRNFGGLLVSSYKFSRTVAFDLFRSRNTLRIIADAPWYVPNMVLRQDLQTTSVKEEIRRFSTQYGDRLYTHPYNLTVHLTVPPDHRRLRHLPTRFHVQM